MKKKGIRQTRQDYIKRDIRELQKLGFSLTDIVGDRSIESLAYTKKSYDRYRKHIRALKNKAWTNQHGIKMTVKQFNQIKKLEKEFTELKSKELDRIAKQNNLNALEIAYLKGKEIMSNKFQSSTKLPNNFGEVKIFDFINKKANIDKTIKEIQDEMDNFKGEDLLESTERVDKLYLESIKALKPSFILSMPSFSLISKRLPLTYISAVFNDSLIKRFALVNLSSLSLVFLDLISSMAVLDFVPLFALI